MSGCMELSSPPNHELLFQLFCGRDIAAGDCLSLIEFNFDEVFSSKRERQQGRKLQ